MVSVQLSLSYNQTSLVTEETFEGKLSKVTIEGTTDEEESVSEEHENMELVQIVKYSDGYYFILRDISDIELERMQMQADIEYIAMMSEIDLEEE